MTIRWALTRLASLLAALACGVLASPAVRAENHALILWIGQYSDPNANLPGIDLDAMRARQIALAMGIPAANIIEKKNQQLTLKGMSDAIAELTNRIKAGDKVIVYYSGHGFQNTNTLTGGKKCSEGLVAQDMKGYVDSQLEIDLARLGAKASQVVMLNDSCFSGGASEKRLPGSGRKLVKKSWGSLLERGVAALTPGSAAAASPGPAAAASPGPAVASAASYRCGDAVNKSALAKTFEVVQRQGANVLYVAAARDNEVSYASAEGSLATEAWAACLADPTTDTDRSGSISGEELRVCAQRHVDGNGQQVNQHISLTGSPQLSVSFAPVDSRPAAAALSAPDVLRDLSAGSDRSYVVKLLPAKSTVRIGQDFLEFSVETNREGYLYIFQVGSDGKTFNLLFPNKVDTDNKVAAGTQRLPRASWALRSAGPAGTNNLMALVSSTPKDFNGQMDARGTFASAPATPSGAKALVVVATGAAAGGNGRYGTSAVVPIVEAP